VGSAEVPPVPEQDSGIAEQPAPAGPGPGTQEVPPAKKRRRRGGKKKKDPGAKTEPSSDGASSVGVVPSPVDAPSGEKDANGTEKASPTPGSAVKKRRRRRKKKPAGEGESAE